MRVGVVGGGQLGRMLGLAGLPLGLDFTFLDPSDAAPAAALGKLIQAPFDDPDALTRLSGRCDVVTYEFENVDVAALSAAGTTPVLPQPEALATAQDRKTEKRTFEAAGIPVAPWRSVDSRDELETACVELGLPIIVKTRRFGYDGKGQSRIHGEEDIAGAWDAIGGVPLLAECLVAFDREVSAIGTRGQGDRLVSYPLTENVHRSGVLHTSRAPLEDRALQAQADRHLRALAEQLDYRGTIAVEFFVIDGRLYGNEFAPRVHNSGHWTIEGAVCSQFENHLRAICGLPLGESRATGHAGMLNLIGTLPPPATVLEIPGVHLHDYRKSPRSGRKLGHVTVIAASAEERDRLLSHLETLASARSENLSL